MVSCKFCQKGDAAKSCTVCRSVTYCSDECQKSDFAAHKNGCTAKATRELIEAVRDSNEDTVRRLAQTPRVLNGRVNFDTGGEEECPRSILGKWTALHMCVRSRNAAMMKILLEHKAKVDIKDVDGETPTFLAASVEDPELIRLLLEAGANPNSSSADDGWSCLMMSVRDGNYEATKHLLDAGADFMSGSDMLGRTAWDLSNQMLSGYSMWTRKDESRADARERYLKQAKILQEYAASRGYFF